MDAKMNYQMKPGYGHENEEPTDLQIDLQDQIDGTIAEAVTTLIDVYFESVETVDGSDMNVPEYEHDINKLTQIRELIEELYGLPDAY